MTTADGPNTLNASTGDTVVAVAGEGGVAVTHAASGAHISAASVLLLVTSALIFSTGALFVRGLGKLPDESYETYRGFMDTRPPEVIANIALCLIHQANYLLDRQIRSLEKSFLQKGGLRERMTRARLEHGRKEE